MTGCADELVMRPMITILRWVSFLLILAVTVAFAAERGTLAQAQLMLARVITHYKAVGRTQALADFTAGTPPFHERDLYVVCIDRQRLVSANGAFPDNVYSSADLLRTWNGKGVGTAAWEVTGATGQGAVRFRWVNPVTHQLETKIAYFARLGEDVCGVGIYSPE
jgi:hypothetical protein